MMSWFWFLWRLCKVLSLVCGKFGGGIEVFCKIWVIWDFNISLFFIGNLEMLFLIVVIIFVVGIFLGVKVKFVFFWSVIVLVVFNGLLEMFSIYLLWLIVLGDEIFDFEVRVWSFFECKDLILLYFFCCCLWIRVLRCLKL